MKYRLSPRSYTRSKSFYKKWKHYERAKTYYPKGIRGYLSRKGILTELNSFKRYY